MKSILLFIMAFAVSSVFAQSKTTDNLHKDFDGKSFFFYHNTLRMINQKADPELDALIKDIEKMKFVIIDKENQDLDFKKVVTDYKAEQFDEVMTSRHAGKNFNIYIKEKNNKTAGMLVLINDESSLMVLDIVGSIALNKVTELYKKMDESSEFGKQMKSLTGIDR